MKTDEKIDYLNRLVDSDKNILDDEQQKRIIEFSKGYSVAVRNEVAVTLCFYINEINKSILLELLNDKNKLVRANAADSLSVYKSKDVLLLLKNKIVEDKYYLVRGYAILAFTEIAISISTDLLEIKEFILSRLEIDKNSFFKLNCFYSLYLLNELKYLNNILAMLHSKNYRIRCATMNVLKNIVTKENYNIIEKEIKKLIVIEETNAVKISMQEFLKLK